MTRNWAVEADASEDGHPCEAALEFRRAAVRSGAVEEVPVDALDLAVAYAWIGKAVSRTTEAGSWVIVGADPNTWQMIRAMAVDVEVRKAALATALSATQSACFGEGDLERLRATKGFQAAAAQVSRTVSHSAHPSDIARVATLSSIASSLPGESLPFPPTRSGNLVMLDSFRKRRHGA